MDIYRKAFYKHWILFPTVWHLPRLSQGRTQGRLSSVRYVTVRTSMSALLIHAIISIRHCYALHFQFRFTNLSMLRQKTRKIDLVLRLKRATWHQVHQRDQAATNIGRVNTSHSNHNTCRNAIHALTVRYK